MVRTLGFSLFAFLLVGCSLFEPRTQGPRRMTLQESNNLPARTDGAPRKRVMVLPFLDAAPDRSAEFREQARRAFLMDLNRSGSMLAVDSLEMKLDAMKSVEGGEFRFADLAKQAKDMGVAALLEGKILDIRVKRTADTVGIMRKMTTTFEAVVRVRMAHARTGKEFFNTTKTVTLEQDGVRLGERTETDRFIRENPQFLVTIVKDAFLDFTPQIVSALDRLVWEGRIAALSGDRIYLNVGRLSGLQIGDLLRVSESGEDVFDPQSGGHIGQVPGRQKGTLEVVSFFGTDGSIAVIHSGGGFKENDKVELY
ncbi:MAG TPA: hypothetical protein PL182_10395 [Pseudobdellovibrionaceae bacterium]|nr:hypothetical protein [Pseudobdellovibrionaceae bacterium]